MSKTNAKERKTKKYQHWKKGKKTKKNARVNVMCYPNNKKKRFEF